MSEVKKVIVDVDCGMDDFLALIFLLNAEKKGAVKIEAITCSKGNTAVDNILITVCRLLEAYQRKDIPVYRGSTNPILKLEKEPDPYFGEDGFGDLTYDKDPDTSVIQKKHSALAIYDIVSANPKEISLILLAPLTNVAITAKLYDDFNGLLKDVWIMGGNYAAVGNTTATGEWNTCGDPESAYIILESITCPIYVLPWEASQKSQLTYEWRYENLVNKNNAALELLTKAEKKQFGNSEKYWKPSDAVLVAAFLQQDEIIVDKEEFNATVELRGYKTRAQFVIDHLGEKSSNAVFFKEFSDSAFKSFALEAIKGNTP